jgi:hypothetical protein
MGFFRPVRLAAWFINLQADKLRPTTILCISLCSALGPISVNVCILQGALFHGATPQDRGPPISVQNVVER